MATTLKKDGGDVNISTTNEDIVQELDNIKTTSETNTTTLAEAIANLADVLRPTIADIPNLTEELALKATVAALAQLQADFDEFEASEGVATSLAGDFPDGSLAINLLAELAEGQPEPAIAFTLGHRTGALKQNNGAPVQYTDTTFGIGFNRNPNHTKIDATLAALDWRYETKFYQDGVFASECFLAFSRPDSEAEIRAINAFLPYTNERGKSVLSFRSDKYVEYDIEGNEILTKELQNGAIYYNGRNVGAGADNVILHFDKSGKPFLRQKNSADDAFLDLPYFDDDDRLLIGAKGLNLVGETAVTGGLQNVFAQFTATTATSNGKHTVLAGPVVNGNYYGQECVSTVSGDYINRVRNLGAGNSVYTALTSGGDAYNEYDNSTYRWRVGLKSSTGAWTVALGSLGNTPHLKIDPVTDEASFPIGDLTAPSGKVEALEISSLGVLKSASKTLANLPSASATGEGALIYCSDLMGGGEFVFSDGADWRVMSSRLVAS